MALRTRSVSTTRKAPAGKTAAGRARAAKAAAPQKDAIALLTGDHRAVKRLFQKFKKLKSARATRAGKAEKADLVQQICRELTVHAEIEEEIFYPATRRAIKDNDLMDEARVEHATIKELVAQLQHMSPGDELYDAKVTVLGEYVDEHVKEEETDMFSKAKKSRLNLAALGAALKERKEELLEELTTH